MAAWLAFAALASCAPPGSRVTGPISVPKVSPVPAGVQPPSPTCRVVLVDRPPEGSQVVGQLEIPGERGKVMLFNEDARRMACDLRATHAVQQEAHIHQGGLFWVVRLYRAPLPDEKPEPIDEVLPQERVEEAQPQPNPGLPSGGSSTAHGRGPFSDYGSP